MRRWWRWHRRRAGRACPDADTGPVAHALSDAEPYANAEPDADADANSIAIAIAIAIAESITARTAD